MFSFWLFYFLATLYTFLEVSQLTPGHTKDYLAYSFCIACVWPLLFSLRLLQRIDELVILFQSMLGVTFESEPTLEDRMDPVEL